MYRATTPPKSVRPPYQVIALFTTDTIVEHPFIKVKNPYIN